jgi:hypothetical protein
MRASRRSDRKARAVICGLSVPTILSQLLTWPLVLYDG